MVTFHEFTNQGNPSDGNPSVFPSFGNTGSPYMATLFVLGLTNSLPVWLLSTSMILSVQTTFQLSSPPPKHHQPQIDPYVDPFPSFPISSPRSSSSPSESLDSSNQEAKKKKKKRMKEEAK